MALAGTSDVSHAGKPLAEVLQVTGGASLEATQKIGATRYPIASVTVWAERNNEVLPGKFGLLQTLTQINFADMGELVVRLESLRERGRNNRRLITEYCFEVTQEKHENPSGVSREGPRTCLRPPVAIH